MTDIAQDLLSALPIDDIANQVGVDPEAARAAISKAAPALLSGMNANALSSPEGAESLLKTIAERHDGSILDADDLLGSIDPAEGEKIVNHVFGPNTDAVTQRLGSTEGEQSILSKILPNPKVQLLSKMLENCKLPLHHSLQMPLHRTPSRLVGLEPQSHALALLRQLQKHVQVLGKLQRLASLGPQELPQCRVK